ncbi:MAG: hypothetical protein Ctma_1167 [Catillopecten margaritatus gill symbiont]|uniref:Uncharacterized protein n=1 Tax=Catillopecten margaritatus gill symbiont TaxID=3083288 RepID=A0AAU6PHE6_9GAMM
MKITNKDKLTSDLVSMLKEDWQGKKGYLTDNEIFKYCKFYTGNFWKNLKNNNKDAA